MPFKEIVLCIVSVSAFILSVFNLQYMLFGETNDIKALVLKFLVPDFIFSYSHL